MSYSLSNLSIYPIKSIQGIDLSSSQVELAGLWGDRRYMLTTHDGSFLTAREYPQLVLISAKQLSNNQWQLSHPNTTMTLQLDPTTFTDTYQDTVIWESSVKAQHCSDLADTWFSNILGADIKLVYFGGQSERYTKRRPENPVSFADGYPFLLTTQASLDELNRTSSETIHMSQFRPNFVLAGSQAFEEDSWKRLRIGKVEFENVKPCARCILTTINPDTAERSKKAEPMKSLGKFRLQPEKKAIHFGINLVALNEGEIHLGDPIDIIEYQEAYKYKDKR